MNAAEKRPVRAALKLLQRHRDDLQAIEHIASVPGSWARGPTQPEVRQDIEAHQVVIDGLKELL